MKHCYLALLLWLILAPPAFAQSVTFSALPAPRQLYPRDVNSVAVVPIAGQVRSAGYVAVSVLVQRNGVFHQWRKQPLTYAQGMAPFSLLATIRAELAQYRVRIFLHSPTDSVQLADRQQLVAGDAYVIAGQSNATAYLAPPAYTYQSDYIRTFGKYTGLDPYNPADTLWTTGNAASETLIGTWGMEMARLITEQYGIPVCVLNGAAGGAPIQLLNIRTTNNPHDLATNYGRMLYRVHKAGLTGKVKAYFYRQGENETSGWASGWIDNFNYLFTNVQLDYPNLRRFYLFQINLLAGTNSATPVFRDYQRKVGALQLLIQPHATVGTLEYDGVHFGLAGHTQIGEEVFRLVARDVYGSTNTEQITCPDVKKAYYTSAAQDELVVQFDEGQRLVWPKDTTVSDVRDSLMTYTMAKWFYLDQVSGSVLSGRVSENRVILRLSGRRTERQLGYLPPNYPEQNSQIPTQPGFVSAFPGPFLTNERGLRAFSFWNVPIGMALPPLGTLTAQRAEGDWIYLTWPDHPAEQQYILERKQASEPTYRSLTTLAANTTTFIDSTLLERGDCRYRLRAVTTTAETMTEVLVPPCQTNGTASTVRSGSWHQLPTWRCTDVPNAGMKTEVAPTHTVTVSREAVAKKLRLGGTLRLRDGGRLRIGD